MLALTVIALTLAVVADTPVDAIVKYFLEIAPLLAALGLFHAAAATLRVLWAKLKIAAGESPTKIDDFLVHLADPPLTAALDLLDRGDVDGARKKIEALKSLVPKR